MSRHEDSLLQCGRADVTRIAQFMQRVLATSDVELFPFVRNPRRWEVVEKLNRNRQPVSTATLVESPRADVFSKFVIRETGDNSLVFDGVTVCLNPGNITKGWLGVLAETTPADVMTELVAPQNVSPRFPGRVWTVYDKPPHEVVHYTKADVADVIEEIEASQKNDHDKGTVRWSGLQRILELFGPPSVDFDLLASTQFLMAGRDRNIMVDDTRRLVKAMIHHARWQSPADLKFALRLAETNEPLVNLMAPRMLKHRFGEMLGRLRHRCKRWHPDEIKRQEREARKAELRKLYGFPEEGAS